MNLSPVFGEGRRNCKGRTSRSHCCSREKERETESEADNVMRETTLVVVLPRQNRNRDWAPHLITSRHVGRYVLPRYLVCPFVNNVNTWAYQSSPVEAQYGMRNTFESDDD